MRGYATVEGYYKEPEKTAQALKEEGGLPTGEIGSLHEAGPVTLPGRLKDTPMVGGENVAAAEIQTCVLSHPAAMLAQVAGVPDVRLLEVAATFTQCRAAVPVKADELIQFCRREIAGFTVPRHVRFVTVRPISTRKIKKSRVREQMRGEVGLKGSRGSPYPRH